MSLVVIIEGREAIPVRGIPYAAWRTSAPMVAAALAGERNDTGLGNLVAWHLDAAGTIGRTLHRDWDPVFSEIERGRPPSGIGLVEQDVERWNRDAVKVLLPACFVWLNDLRLVVERSHFTPGNGSHQTLDDADDHVSFIASRSTDTELNLAPVGISAELLSFIREGFDAKKIADDGRSLQLAPTDAWPLKKPVRDDGLASPIFRVLKAARDAGGAKPTAKEVLESFRTSLPGEIVKVMANDCDYFGRTGEVRSADLESIRKRIAEMTAAQAPAKARKRQATRARKTDDSA